MARERITDADVLRAFEQLKQAAQSAGIRWAEKWTLQHGNGSYGYQYRVISNAGFHKGRDLGSTKREAYNAMLHMAEAFWLVNSTSQH